MTETEKVAGHIKEVEQVKNIEVWWDNEDNKILINNNVD